MPRMTRKQESQNLMADHGTGITDGLVECEPIGKGRYRATIGGIKFDVSKGVAEEVLFKFTKALRPYAGYSIFDEIMLALDPVIDRLMAQEPAEDGRDPGRAESLCLALAIIRNPDCPDVDAEKERQMERYRLREFGEAPNEVRRANHKQTQRAERAAKQRKKKMPEENWELFVCSECGSEYETEDEATNCADGDLHCDHGEQFDSMEEANNCNCEK